MNLKLYTLALLLGYSQCGTKMLLAVYLQTFCNGERVFLVYGRSSPPEP